MSAPPVFTIIIPNFNGLRFLKKCLAALSAQTFRDFTVLIVDNGSTDGSKEYIGSLIPRSEDPAASGAPDPPKSSDPPDLPGIGAIFLDTNTGFTGAVNAGIAAALTKYVVLLNNDTEPLPDYLKALYDVFKEDVGGRVFAVSPKMIQLGDKTRLDDAGDGYCLAGWAFQRGVGQRTDSKRYNRRAHIFSACAGAAAYRRSALEELKFDGDRAYLDPLHFAYLEDLDISFRARVRGYDIVYAPDSEVYHVGSGTSGSRYNSFKVRLSSRNNIYLNYKNMPLFMLLLNLPFLLAGTLVKQIFFIKKGFGKDYAYGLSDGIKGLGMCRAHKTPFTLKRTLNYIKLEYYLVRDTFGYAADFVSRHIFQARGSQSSQASQTAP